MNTGEITIQSIQKKYNRDAALIVTALVISWLFTAFCGYLSRKTGKDWFPRSGSLMCLFGAAGAFRLTNCLHHALVTVLKFHIESPEETLTVALEPPKRYQILSFLAYLTGIVGTLIWGYGDLLLPLFP